MSRYRISFNDFHHICIIHVRGVAPDADLLTQAVSLLLITPTLPDYDDCADGIEGGERIDLSVNSEVHQQDQQPDVIDEEVQNRIFEQDTQNIDVEGLDKTFSRPESDDSFTSEYEERRLTSTPTSRSSLGKYPFALLDREAPDWLNALDVGSPRQNYTSRFPLEWLNLEVPEKQILFAMEKEEYPDNSGVVICPLDESTLWQGFERITERVPEELAYNDTTEDNTEDSVEDWVRKVVTHTKNSLEALDLDVVFGASATDLEDEHEEPMIIRASSGSDNASIPTSTISILRSHLPQDLSDEINDYYSNLPPEFHEESQRTFAKFFSVANVEWEYMSVASQQLKSLGAYIPQSLEEADRSCDWFWKNGRRLDTESPPSVPVVNGKVERPLHHLNFLGPPFYQKSSTPAYPPTPARKNQYTPSISSKLCTVEFADYSSVEVRQAISCPQSPKENTGEAESKAVISGQVDDDLSASSFLSGGRVFEKVVEEATVPFGSKEAVFFPAEEYSPGYPEIFAACDEINNAEKAAAWKDVLVGIRALKPFFRNQKLDSQATYEGNVEDTSEDESKKSEESTCAMSTIPNEQPVPEILRGDLDQIEMEPLGLNEIIFGPIALAVVHKASQLASWVSSCLW
ncbi:hypothetical protein MMC29_006233 [Sticta canariensis]|nr:hypothetical protein [Sticta canariensis]